MSMTKEEAIKQIEKLKSYCEYMADSDESGAYLFDLDGQALVLALSALRPVSREQVEKVWRGECDCSKSKACCTCCSMRCQYCIGQSEYRQATFCMKCGRPLTDEAVDMVMERLEALRDE